MIIEQSKEVGIPFWKTVDCHKKNPEEAWDKSLRLWLQNIKICNVALNSNREDWNSKDVDGCMPWSPRIGKYWYRRRKQGKGTNSEGQDFLWGWTLDCGQIVFVMLQDTLKNQAAPYFTRIGIYTNEGGLCHAVHWRGKHYLFCNPSRCSQMKILPI